MSTGDQTDVASRAYAYAEGQDHRDFPGVQTRVVAGWIAGYRAAELDQTTRVDVRQAATELDRTNAADALRVAAGNLYDFLDSEGVGDLLNPASAAALRRRADAVQDAIRATTSLPVDSSVTTDEVYTWHVGRFGEPDVRMVALKLAEEAGEVSGAVVKRAEGAYRPAKGLVTHEDWTRALFDEIGDVGIVLHVLAAREGTTLDELVRRRFRDDVSQRTDQERPKDPVGYEKPDGCRCPGPMCRNDRAYGTEL